MVHSNGLYSKWNFSSSLNGLITIFYLRQKTKDFPWPKKKDNLEWGESSLTGQDFNFCDNFFANKLQKYVLSSLAKILFKICTFCSNVFVYDLLSTFYFFLWFFKGFLFLVFNNWSWSLWWFFYIDAWTDIMFSYTWISLFQITPRSFPHYLRRWRGPWLTSHLT